MSMAPSDLSSPKLDQADLRKGAGRVIPPTALGLVARTAASKAVRGLARVRPITARPMAKALHCPSRPLLPHHPGRCRPRATRPRPAKRQYAHAR